MPAVTTGAIRDEPTLDATLHVAVGLGNAEWTLTCELAIAVARRVRTMWARALARLGEEFEAARRHLGLSRSAPRARPTPSTTAAPGRLARAPPSAPAVPSLAVA